MLTVQKKYYEQVDPAEADGPTEARVFRTRCLRHPRELYVWAKAFFYKLAGRQREVQESVRRGVISTRDRNLGRKAAAKRLVLSVLYTPDEYWGWLPFAVARSIVILRRYRINTIISTGPPFTAHLIGLTLKMLYPISWVADFRDPWSPNPQKPDELQSRLSNWLDHRFEAAVVRRADRVVCVTPAMTEAYRKRYPALPAEKWATISNGFDAEEFRSLRAGGRPREFTISYLGSIEYSRNPEPLLKAMGELLKEGAMAREDVRIKLIGKCRYAVGLSVESMIQEYGLEGVVQLIDLLPRPDALREMVKSDVLVLLANDQPLQVPGKAYEYLAAGPAILVLTGEGATADLIRKVGGGAIVGPADAAGIKQVLKKWHGAFKSSLSSGASQQRRPLGVIDEYEWQHLGARYSALLEDGGAKSGRSS